MLPIAILNGDRKCVPGLVEAAGTFFLECAASTNNNVDKRGDIFFCFNLTVFNVGSIGSSPFGSPFF